MAVAARLLLRHRKFWGTQGIQEFDVDFVDDSGAPVLVGEPEEPSTITGGDVVLTGLEVGENEPVTEGDTVNGAVAKFQAQIAALETRVADLEAATAG